MSYTGNQKCSYLFHTATFKRGVKSWLSWRDSFSWKTFKVFCHKKSERNCCVENEKKRAEREREREREPQCLSHLHTAGQSRCEVGVNIGFRLHKWLDTVRPNTCQILEKCEGGGVCSYSTSQQEPTDRIYLLAFLIPQWRPSHVLPPFRSRDIWLKNRKGS